MDTNGACRGISRALLLAFTALSVAAASGCSSGAPLPRVSAAPPPSATSTRLPLSFEANQGQTDPGVVRMVVEGAERLRLDAGGNLLIETAGGPLQMRAPVAYQETAHGRQTVTVRYVVRDGAVGFDIPVYDRGRPLVIDPVLLYSSYLGGNGWDAGAAITIDDTGAAYIT